MKLKTSGSEVLYLRIIVGIKVEYYPLKQFLELKCVSTQRCIG